VEWLAVSIVASIVLTVVLNVAIRVFPRSSEQIGQRLTELGEREPGGRIYVPWKAMIIGSVVLTIVVNLLLWTLL
jgi:hypothetical protein